MLNGLGMFAVISSDLVRMDLDMKAVEIACFVFMLVYYTLSWPHLFEACSCQAHPFFKNAQRSNQFKIANATLLLRARQPHVSNFARMFLVQVTCRSGI